ncbi:uncharacterized protein [Leuresthes tenuis]|uniref:uncharacterized protein n=1 Tax=Leuresthes tenuis TaxID=355514 RepID=UPI003B50E5E5
MGSLKDEMRGFKEEHQPCEKTEDGGHPVSSGCSSSAEGHPLHTSRESTTREDYQPKRDMNVSSVEERNECPITKDQVLSGVDCDNTEKSGSEHVKDSAQTNVVPLTPQTTAAQNDATINLQNDGDPADKNMALGRRQEADIESILVPVPSTPDPSDPRSPAPFGQHHMRTQVSLEVVQCRSAATSPMTPPEGGHSFFFPSTFGNSGGGDAKDTELQVGRQVEFCSVATSPMTPKTPSTTAFPELTGRDVVQKEEKVKQSWEQREYGQQESLTATKSAASGVKDSQVTLEDITQQCKQQRMGSMDQDITILVTHYGNNGEEEEGKSETYFCSTEPDMMKIDENVVVGGNNRDIKRGDGKENVSAEAPAHVQAESSTHCSKMQPEETRESIKAKDSEVIESKDASEELTEASVMKSVPESPAPFGCHNIRTQVSLEVVQCQSVATSPMTPPEGDQAFYFPSSFGKCGSVGRDTKDAELQGGTQVEFRSVATAPMTPRTPVVTTFPEIKKEASLEDKIVEKEDKKKQEMEDKEEAHKELKEDKKEVINCTEKSEEKCEEPVQEVSWDEKGMTWEVYGAVVEVAVLGSAIQKHLEKQVLKQKRQSSMPPPPPLNPSATPLILQGGSGKGRSGKRGEQDGKVSRRRRNPFRLLMENIQQPHCCSRAQTSE